MLELDLEVEDTVGERMPERILGIKPVVEVAGVSFPLSFPAGCVGVGVVSEKNQKHHTISLNS